MSDRRPRLNSLIAVSIVLALGLLWGWREQSFKNQVAGNPGFQGQTMGTFYNIKLVNSRLDRKGLDDLDSEIDDALQEVERRMSVYDPDSEISVFNRAGKGEEVAVSETFLTLVEKALEIAETTGGAFDPTVGPLVDLWGFGKAERTERVPSDDEIERIMARTGWEKIEVSADGRLIKESEGVEMDFGAIAKGYAVDQLADVIRAADCDNFMVEVGGEVYSEGVNSHGIPWRIGVDTPELKAVPGANLRGVLEVSGVAVATSGDYRNFFETENGELYSHIIDPRSGRPARMPPASVTVIASDCMTADALATALFVLGEREGLNLVERIEDVEALFVISDYGSIFRDSASSGFVAATNYKDV